MARRGNRGSGGGTPPGNQSDGDPRPPRRKKPAGSAGSAPFSDKRRFYENGQGLRIIRLESTTPPDAPEPTE